MRMQFRPLGAEQVYDITIETHRDFLFLFQQAVLLGLKEAGKINHMQLRKAESVLHRQYRENSKAIVKSTGND